MASGAWETLFNLAAFVCWWSIWNESRRGAFFNPHLQPLVRARDVVVGYLRPLLPGVRPAWIAGLALAVILALRGLLAPYAQDWRIVFGFEVRFAATDSVLRCMLWSVTSFALFLFRFWSLTLLYVPGLPFSRSDHVSLAVHEAGAPFTSLPPVARPAVLLGLGLAIACLTQTAGLPPPGVLAGAVGSVPARFVEWGILTLSAWVSALLLVRTLLFLSIVGSWVGLFTGASALGFFARQWTEFLLGPLRRYPLRLGMLDLTPFVLIFLIGFAHHGLQMLLWQAYRALP